MSGLTSRGTNLHERVEPFSDLLGSSGTETHVIAVSVSPAAVHPSAQVTAQASPKSKRSGVVDEECPVGPDKTVQTESK